MLKIHFLNVGHGDCIIIQNFETNRHTIIDINRTKEMDKNSLNEVNEYYKNGLAIFSFRGFALENQLSQTILESRGYHIKLTDPIEYLKQNNINNKPQFTDKVIKRLLENGFDFLSEKVVFLFGFMRVKAYSVYNVH